MIELVIELEVVQFFKVSKLVINQTQFKLTKIINYSKLRYLRELNQTLINLIDNWFNSN